MERIVAEHESEVPELKRIGIIGGFGQWASLDIINRILKESVVRIPQYGNRGYPPMDIRMCNHAPMLLNEDGSFPEVLEPSEELLEASRFVGTNSDFIILLANTPHLFANQVEEAAGKPLLSIVDVTVEEAVKRNCKRVGVMAIGPTLERGLYQNPLEASGIEVIPLPKDLSERLDNEAIYPVQEGANPTSVHKAGYDIVSYFERQKVDRIILGCTELPILLQGYSESSHVLNPSQLLAIAVVEKSLRR